MTPWLFFSAVLLTYFTGIQKNRDVFSPWRLYIYSHGMVLGVSLLYLHPAMTPLKPLSWLVILGSAIAFFAGHLSFELVSYKKMPVNFYKKVEVSHVHWNVIIAIVLFYYALYMGVYFINASQVDIPAFSKKLGGTRLKFFGVNYYTMLVLLIFPFMAMVSYSYRKFSGIKGVKRWLLLLLDGLLIISFALLLNRNSILWMVVLIMMVSHYSIKRFSGKIVVLATLLFVLFIFVAGATRTGHSLKNIMKNKDMVELIAKTFYTYPANNVWNFDYNISPDPTQRVHPKTYGFEHTSPFFDFIGLSGTIRSGLVWDDLFMKTSVKVKNYNTVLYQYHLWKEFGWPGVILVPFLAAFVICFIYKKMLLERNIAMVWLYGQFAFFILFSFMVPFWLFNIAWFGIFFSMFVMYFIKKKPVQPAYN